MGTYSTFFGFGCPMRGRERARARSKVKGRDVEG
jgi:hypothetical protein